MTISQMLLPEYEYEMANTRKILEVVPEDKFSWKPHEKSMALGRLASHIAEMANWANTTLTTDKLELSPADKPFNAATKQELLESFDKHVAAAKQALSKTNDEDMGKTWNLVYGGQTVVSQPRAGILRGLIISHTIHHRGQLTVYLRLLNVPVPGMYGPTADFK